MLPNTKQGAGLGLPQNASTQPQGDNMAWLFKEMMGGNAQGNLNNQQPAAQQVQQGAMPPMQSQPQQPKQPQGPHNIYKDMAARTPDIMGKGAFGEGGSLQDMLVNSLSGGVGMSNFRDARKNTAFGGM